MYQPEDYIGIGIDKYEIRSTGHNTMSNQQAIVLGIQKNSDPTILRA